MHALAVILAGLSALPLAAGSPEAEHTLRVTPVVAAVREVRPAVVNISTTQIVKMSQGLFGMPGEDIFNFFNMPSPLVREVPMHSLGSGFVIHPSGYIMTNHHVIQQATEIKVSFADKTTLPARKVGAAPEFDVCVIKVDAPKPLPTVRFGRGNDLMYGETVIAIGNPLGYQHSVTTGVVSAIDRTLEFQGGVAYRNLIQTDASINAGNSGGPLLNILGELIGMNTAIRGDAQNIGFAINVDTILRVLPEVLDVENIRRIHLGFNTAPSPGGRGIQVVSVEEASPAARAGLVAGETIVRAAGHAIDHSVDFYVLLLNHPENHDLALVVRRNGADHTITVPFKVKPRPDGAQLAREKLGAIVRQLTAEQAARDRLSDRPVVQIEGVLPKSPAETIGLRSGDILYQLDRSYVSTLDDLGQLLERARPGQRLYIRIIRFVRGGYISADTYIQVR